MNLFGKGVATEKVLTQIRDRVMEGFTWIAGLETKFPGSF